MRAIHRFVQRITFLFIVIASTLFLTACSSVLPVSPPLPVPPPYIPYESHPGEAANVRKVLDNIRKNQHNNAPRARRSKVRSSSTYPRQPANPTSPATHPRLPKYPVKLTITNDTKCKLGFYLLGPTTRKFGVEAGRSEDLDITAGSYEFGVDTRLCGNNLRRLHGEDVYESGSSYTLTFSQKDIQPQKGNFVVENNTEAKLTVKVGGARHTIAPGSFSIELPSGPYTAVISARCGSVNESFDITNGSTYTGKYWCTVGKIIMRPPAVGYFKVDNDTGATITIRLAGRTHKVRPGSTILHIGTILHFLNTWNLSVRSESSSFLYVVCV